MLARPKPVIFEPYGSRRTRSRVPRWLILLLVGIAVGAAGVVYVQERHLPPRLSAKESAELRASFEQAESERLRLQLELDNTAKRLDTALADNKGLAGELGASRDSIERLRGDLASLVVALPPDPRGGAVAVRAARFALEGTTLSYDVLLSRERAGAKPFSGVVQFVVGGESARGAEAAVTSPPVAVSVGQFESLRGSLPLPEGFKPRQATIKVLDRVDGNQIGMRVMYVK